MSCCIIAAAAAAAASDAGNLISPNIPLTPTPLHLDFVLYPRTQSLAAVKSVIRDFIKEMNDRNAATLT